MPEFVPKGKKNMIRNAYIAQKSLLYDETTIHGGKSNALSQEKSFSHKTLNFGEHD